MCQFSDIYSVIKNIFPEIWPKFPGYERAELISCVFHLIECRLWTTNSLFWNVNFVEDIETCIQT